MKKWIIGGGIVVAVAVAVLCFYLWPRKFELSAEYYDNSEFLSIDAEELQDLIDEKKSFALLVYQSACQASEDFEKIVEEFSEQEQISFEEISFPEAKNSGLVEGLTYYPSVALYRDGKMVTFLKTDEGDDLTAYQSLSGFTEWWGKYIK